jgi:ADP-heptose:LPS heptosyltransferase
MNEILVLNLGRYGDLIQTTPLLRRLKSAYPSARVTLVLQQRFKAILPLITGYDRFFLFDQDSLTRSLATPEGIPLAYGALEEFFESLAQQRYDLVVNLTSSPLSEHLVALLDAATVAGKSSDRDGHPLVKGEWGLYLFSFLRGDSRRYNRINLVDIFCKMAALQPDGQPVELFETEAGRFAAASFLDRAEVGDRPLVGLQLGASDSTRCWSAASFARLSDLLQESVGVRTILLGSPAERPLAQQARALMKHEPVDAVGRTDIQGLFSLLHHCRLLVSNDTGTMHFAAAAGIPTVMLTLGPASFLCTGPLNAGNLALQPPLPCSPCRYDLSCNNPICRDSITVEAVGNACRLLLGDKNALADDTSGVKFFRSEFGKDGYLEWQPLCNADPVIEALTRRYSRLWKKILDGNESHPDSQEPLFPQLLRLTGQGCEVTSQIMKAARHSPISLKTMAALAEQEARVDSEIRCLAATTPDLSPLVDFMTIMKENITAIDLYDIAAVTHDIYKRGNRLATLL